MKDGFIKTAAGSIRIKISDTEFNAEQIKNAFDFADSIRVNILVLPELCITGYSCGDLFFSEKLLGNAIKALTDICEYTKGKYTVLVVGLPVVYRSKLYNCAAILCNGKILGIVPKTHLPNYDEYYEKRQFSSFESLTDNIYLNINGKDIPFGNNIIFTHNSMRNYTFGIEICEDLWAPVQQSEGLCLAGANIICNLSASDEYIGKEHYRRLLIKSTSSRLLCGYIYSNADYTESTQDSVCSSHHIICENGIILNENKPFGNNHIIFSEIDVSRICSERMKKTSFICKNESKYRFVTFTQKIINTKLTRKFDKNPFVPYDNYELNGRAKSILKIQSYGLARRIEHTCAKKCVIGVSGGLDSTLAILASVKAMEVLNRPATDVVAITMPCFGTSKRTKSNSEKLCKCLGITFKEINITDAVNQHFKDIDQNPEKYDVTFENSQARERTQVLMDYANKIGGIVVGTGDLSELALGWATYNGDHMSMYGVNASVPKTLIRYIIKYVAENSGKKLAEVLSDILDTPVSPELLPVDKDGNMTQKTEDLVGPYELHDFFLYYLIKFGCSPKKIFRLAKEAFDGEYDDNTIKLWLKTFIKRFFAQQFKRSCMPDGPKVGSITLSPRSDFRMPTDASSKIWIDEVESL
ncbi:MAG: NAD(+) synthase [Clostridia bacterium]|nr:NAD(+) synthase [Clostridia bacterium]